MRLHSTPLSAKHREISIVAIIETVFAVVLAIWLARRLETTVYLLCTGVIAPFLLLRTPWSTKLAISWFDPGRLGERLLNPFGRVSGTLVARVGAAGNWFGWLITRAPWLARGLVVASYLALLIMFVLLMVDSIVNVLIFMAARILSVLVGCVTLRWRILKYIPRNWARYSLCMDIFHPPEVLPGIETIPSYLAPYRMSLRLGQLRQAIQRPGFVNQPGPNVPFGSFIPWLVWLAILVPALSAYVPSFCIHYAPSILYRLAIKSSSVVWIPLVFTIRRRFGKLSGVSYARDIRYGAFAKAARCWAAIIIIATGLSLTVSFARASAIKTLERSTPAPILAVVDVFIPMNGHRVRIDGWHIARLCNGIIAFGLLFYADVALRRLDERRWRDVDVRRNLRLAGIVQDALALYTSACSIVVLGRIAYVHGLPDVECRLFPW